MSVHQNTNTPQQLFARSWLLPVPHSSSISAIRLFRVSLHCFRNWHWKKFPSHSAGQLFPQCKGQPFSNKPYELQDFPKHKKLISQPNLPTKLRPCKTQAPSTKKIRVQCIGILIMHWPLQRKKILPNCIHILSHHSLIWPATSTVSFMPFHQESFSLSKCRYSMGPPKTMPVPWAKTHKVKPHLMIVSASATGAIHVS